MRNVIVCIVTILGVVASPAAAQQTAKLKFSVKPGRAGVFVDGNYLGPAANFRVGRTYSVSAGEHEVRLSEPRYEDVVKKVTIPAGKTATISETMKELPAPKPPFGTLRTISTDKFAAVYVNGHFMGHTDEFSNSHQGLLLNPGDYAVKIVSPGSTSAYEEQVKIQANTIAVVRVK